MTRQLVMGLLLSIPFMCIIVEMANDFILIFQNVWL